MFEADLYFHHLLEPETGISYDRLCLSGETVAGGCIQEKDTSHTLG